MTNDEYWKKINEEFSKSVEDFMKERPAIVTAAKEITAGATTPDEKLHKIYDRVQGLRHLSYEREKTEQETKKEKQRDNNRVEDALKNGYGSTNELNELFIALARAAGVQAEPALLSDRGEPLVKDVPDLSQFDHVAAAVTLDGKTRYFDPGVPYLPFGVLRWDNAYTYALINARKSFDWVHTTDIPASASAYKRTADVHLDGDTIVGNVHVELTGQEALKHRLHLRFDDEAAQKKSLEDEAKKWFPDGSTVKLTALSGMTTNQDPIAADFDISIANVVSLTGSRTLVPLSIFEAAARNPFAAERRKHPFFIDYTYEVNDTVTLRVPDGFKIESLPNAVQNDAGVLKYTNASTIVDRSIKYTRNLHFGTAFITEDHYSALRHFMSQVTTADQASASLRKQ